MGNEEGTMKLLLIIAKFRYPSRSGVPFSLNLDTDKLLKVNYYYSTARIA